MNLVSRRLLLQLWLGICAALGAPLTLETLAQNETVEQSEQTAEEVQGEETTEVATETVATEEAAVDELWRPEPLREVDVEQFAADLEELTADRQRALDDLILERTIPDLQESLTNGLFTGREFTLYYLARIREFDVTHYHSVLELNPDAVWIASALDEERSAGIVRSPLHGIPLLIKDNIATGDEMHTTAGAAALSDAFSFEDSDVVDRLRNAGAVILGKANLSEWSYWMSSIGPSGFSSLGGQVLCPFDDSVDPVGSSTGPAVSTSLNFAAAAVGTETIGSIIAPSSRASVVGMRPTLGVISQTGIIPVTDEMDTAGPIARTVTDVAHLLAVLADFGVAAYDPDAPDDAAGIAATDLIAAVSSPSLQGMRVGIPSYSIGLTDNDAIEQDGLSLAVALMRDAGAEVVVLPHPGDLPVDLYELETSLNTLMNVGVQNFLAGSSTAFSTVADIVAFNEVDPHLYAPFGMDRLYATADPVLTEEDARVWAEESRNAVRAIWDPFFANNNIEAFLSLETNYSFEIGLGGYPAITIPLGLAENGAPYGITLTAPRYTEPRLLTCAYGFEQASLLRVVPEAKPQD